MYLRYMRDDVWRKNGKDLSGGHERLMMGLEEGFIEILWIIVLWGLLSSFKKLIFEFESTWRRRKWI